MNIQRVLNIAMCVMVILASVVYIGQTTINTLAYVAEQEARSQCIVFGFPDAFIVDGIVYCQSIFQGTDYVLSMPEILNMVPSYPEGNQEY